MQSDIICYGYDLPSYLANEFKIEGPRRPSSAPQNDLVIGEYTD